MTAPAARKRRKAREWELMLDSRGRNPHVEDGDHYCDIDVCIPIRLRGILPPRPSTRAKGKGKK